MPAVAARELFHAPCPVRTAVTLQDGTVLAAAGPEVLLVRPASGRIHAYRRHAAADVSALAVSRAGDFVLSGDQAGGVHLRLVGYLAHAWTLPHLGSGLRDS